MIANVRDRRSVEEIYPQEAFAFDAGINSRARTTIHNGVRILSSIEENGDFEIERASRQIGETGRGPDAAIFLSPNLISAADALVEGGGYGTTSQRKHGAQGHKAADYHAFIDSITEAARQADIRPAPARRRALARSSSVEFAQSSPSPSRRLRFWSFDAR